MIDVDITGVTKTFAGRPPVAALRGVDLRVPAGSVVAVLGPSGCGKTTLLRVVAGFERPDAGTITFDGTVVAGDGRATPPEHRRVGIVPQEGALFPHLDVAGNVGFALRSLGRTDRRRRVAELLELVGLAGYERRRPHELSGGQQQRIALARALAPRPAIVLLDEPFTALDVGLRARLRDDVARVLREAGTSALLVTHDPAEALVMADAVAVMREGRILQTAPSREIYHHPVDLDTARTLGDVVVLRGEARGRTATSVLGELPLFLADGEVSGPVELVLRPEQIVVDPASPVVAEVVAVRFYGHDAMVELSVADQRFTARWSSLELPADRSGVGVRVVGTATPGAATRS